MQKRRRKLRNNHGRSASSGQGLCHWFLLPLSCCMMQGAETSDFPAHLMGQALKAMGPAVGEANLSEMMEWFSIPVPDEQLRTSKSAGQRRNASQAKPTDKSQGRRYDPSPRLPRPSLGQLLVLLLFGPSWLAFQSAWDYAGVGFRTKNECLPVL